MTRRLLALIAAVILMVAPAAQADYVGPLVQAVGFTIEVITTSRVALTVLYVTDRGTLIVDSIDVYDGSSGTPPPPVTYNIPKRTSRAILIIDALTNESGTVKLTSGANLFQVVANPSATIQFEVQQ